MHRKTAIALGMTLGLALGIVGCTAASQAFAYHTLTGVGPGVTGNDTGGIIPYSPAVDHVYRELAAAHCARWGRLAHVTSVGRRYGDYISFVCIDKPWMIH
jgi:hypothetical protein